LATALLVVAAWGAQGQTNFTVNWFTVDGGGGSSTGAVYSISGTVGQADTGAMEGGDFSLMGGFWAVIGLVQEPGSPRLTINQSGPATFVLSWAYPSTGFALQQSSDLSATNWASVTNAAALVGDQWQVTWSPLAGRNFFRLRKPLP
jgi:hypothetical protein